MALENKTGADGARKKYYYKKCPHCGSASHIDNLYCPKCKKRMREGVAEKIYPTETDPELGRSNIDHPDGCPACGGNCRYCFSFGVKTPHPKAHCEHCEKDMKVCCLRARKLPSMFDALAEAFPGVSTEEIITGKVGPFKAMLEEFNEMLSEKIRECWSHVRAMKELTAGLPFERTAEKR